MFIFDSQVHLYPPDSPEHPWPEQFRGQVRDQTEYLPSTLLPLMDGAGVQSAAVVPPVTSGWDNAPQLEWSQEYPDRFGVMGRFDLLDPNRARLETWRDQPGMLGLRFIGTLERGEWADEEFEWFWSGAERLGIPVMLLPQKERIQLVHTIAHRHPGLQLIVDHFGATLGNPEQHDPWEYIDDVLALVKYPNVIGKLSALPLNTMEGYPFASQTPYIKRAYDTFGPERLAWGSDGSRLRRSTYKESVDHMLHTIDFLSEQDKEWIMGKTLARALNWKIPEATA